MVTEDHAMVNMDCFMVTKDYIMVTRDQVKVTKDMDYIKGLQWNLSNPNPRNEATS